MSVIKRNKADFSITDNGVYMSRHHHIYNAKSITSSGKNVFLEGVQLRADLFIRSNVITVSLGRMTFFEKNVVIRPPFKFYKREFTYLPVKFGDYIFVGENTIINAASIGNNVYIGKNCVIGRNAIVKNCVKIMDNTVIPNDAILSSFGVYSGSPYRQVGDLSEFTSSLFEKEAKERYLNFCNEFE